MCKESFDIKRISEAGKQKTTWRYYNFARHWTVLYLQYVEGLTSINEQEITPRQAP